MADDLEDESEFADSLHERDWSKLERRSYTSGYREGRSQGSEDAMQRGFDSGYSLGLEVSLRFNRLRGELAVKQHLKSVSENEFLTKSSQLLTSEKSVLDLIKKEFGRPENAGLSADQWIKKCGKCDILDAAPPPT